MSYTQTHILHTRTLTYMYVTPVHTFQSLSPTYSNIHIPSPFHSILQSISPSPSLATSLPSSWLSPHWVQHRVIRVAHWQHKRMGVYRLYSTYILITFHYCILKPTQWSSLIPRPLPMKQSTLGKGCLHWRGVVILGSKLVYTNTVLGL